MALAYPLSAAVVSQVDPMLRDHSIPLNCLGNGMVVKAGGGDKGCSLYWTLSARVRAHQGCAVVGRKIEQKKRHR